MRGAAQVLLKEPGGLGTREGPGGRSQGPKPAAALTVTSGGVQMLLSLEDSEALLSS